MLRSDRRRVRDGSALRRPPLGAGRRRHARRQLASAAARPFYTATPAEPHGVTLRRRFRLHDRTLTGISDEALDGSLADAASSLDDFLLEELERARDARMRDIVATIQADQYGLIARCAGAAARHPGRPRDRQDGGRAPPGVVPPVRAPRHAATHPRRGPESEVHGLRLARPAGARRGRRRPACESPSSSPGAAVTLDDPPDVERLKADARLAEVVQRAVELRSAGAPRSSYCDSRAASSGWRQVRSRSCCAQLVRSSGRR